MWLFSKYRKVPHILRKALKDLDSRLNKFQKEQIKSVKSKKELASNYNMYINFMRAHNMFDHTLVDEDLYEYLGSQIPLMNIYDYYFMVNVYYWMFVTKGGFGVDEMLSEHHEFRSLGVNGYGRGISAEDVNESIKIAEEASNIVSIEEASKIDEPVLDPFERGEAKQDARRKFAIHVGSINQSTTDSHVSWNYYCDAGGSC